MRATPSPLEHLTAFAIVFASGILTRLAKMARWWEQFDYASVDILIEQLRKTNALEESPVQYMLLNLDGGHELMA